MCTMVTDDPDRAEKENKNSGFHSERIVLENLVTAEIFSLCIQEVFLYQFFFVL